MSRIAFEDGEIPNAAEIATLVRGCRELAAARGVVEELRAAVPILMAVRVATGSNASASVKLLLGNFGQRLADYDAARAAAGEPS